MIPRKIQFRKLALKDMQNADITRAEFDVIYRELRRIAGLEAVNFDAAVCKVVQTRRQWYRLKIVKPTQIRVFFTIDDGEHTLIVEAVLRRTENCYKIAEIFWQSRSRSRTRKGR